MGSPKDDTGLGVGGVAILAVFAIIVVFLVVVSLDGTWPHLLSPGLQQRLADLAHGLGISVDTLLDASIIASMLIVAFALLLAPHSIFTRVVVPLFIVLFVVWIVLVVGTTGELPRGFY